MLTLPAVVALIIALLSQLVSCLGGELCGGSLLLLRPYSPCVHCTVVQCVCLPVLYVL